MGYKSVTRNNDFTRAYRKGKPLVHHQVVLYVNKNRVGHTRVGITASKKTGGAVRRNRARRVVRHALYQVLPQNIGGFDLIFVVRGQTADLKSWQLAATLNRMFAKSEVPALRHLAAQNGQKGPGA